MVGLVVATLGCREDTGTAPAGARPSAAGVTAQCLAQSTDMTGAGSALVHSRLASVLLRGSSAPGLTPAGGEALCLSREGGRWQLQRTANPELVAE